jgi:hypothetical protein
MINIDFFISFSFWADFFLYLVALDDIVDLLLFFDGLLVLLIIFLKPSVIRKILLQLCHLGFTDIDAGFVSVDGLL